jgi:hypothetical protein
MVDYYSLTMRPSGERWRASRFFAAIPIAPPAPLVANQQFVSLTRGSTDECV